MTSENQTNESQPTTEQDFSDYRWIPAAKPKFNAVCVRNTATGRLYLGIKGFDKKHNAPGYILVPLTPEARDAIVMELQAVRFADSEEE